MSFMAGFGEAFSRSFEAETERSDRRKQDTFKLTFDRYMKNKDKRDEAEKASTKNINKAKSLAEMYGQPPEAWTKVYEMLQSDVDDTDIRKTLETGKFKVVQRPDGPEVSERPIKPSEASPVELQTMEAIGQTSSPVAPAQEARTSIFGQLFNRGPKISVQDRNVNSAMDRIAQIEGRPRQEIEASMGGYTPPSVDSSNVTFERGAPERKADPFANSLGQAQYEFDQAEVDLKNNPQDENARKRHVQALQRVESLEQAAWVEASQKARAEGRLIPGARVKIVGEDGKVKYGFGAAGKDGVTTVDGKPVPTNARVEALTEDEEKAYGDLAGKLAKPQQEFNNKYNAMTGVIREAGGMAGIVDATGGRVLSERVANLSQFAQSWGSEIVTGLDMIESFKKSDKPLDPSKLTSMEESIDKMIGKGVNDLGTARALYDAKVKILSYKLAMIEGQDGRGLAETERKLFEQLASGGSSTEKFNQNMANIIFSRMDNLSQEARTLNGRNVEQDGFEGRYGHRPFNLASDPEKEIMSDEKLKPIIERFLPFNNTQLRSGNSAPPTEPKGQIQTRAEPTRPPEGADQKVLQDWYASIPKGAPFIDPGDGKTYIKE